jgi:cytochrome c-type biogenesis protein
VTPGIAVGPLALLADALAFREVSVGAYLIAFVGGAISFLSPCVLPLAPGYLSMVSGFDLAAIEAGGGARRRRILATTGAFIAGFGTVFTLLGISASAIGGVFFEHQRGLTRLSGLVMILMAAFMLGSLVLRAPWLYRELRFHPEFGALGRFAPVVMGAAFGFGWSPCVGPTMASVLTIAGAEGRAFAGATLMMTYSLGLGVPFLILGLGLGRLTGALALVKRHLPAVVVCSSLVMAGFGVLLATDQLVELSAWLQRTLQDTPLEWLVELG